MPGIFINYRREDSEGYAITLQDRLAKHFGNNQLFMDVDNIEPGVDFMEAIEKSLSSCQVMLVLIGARWLEATDEVGNCRLDNPQDPLRIEIETALRSDARVIPILLHGTAMPESDKLPPSLAPLTRRHAIEISSSRRDYDLERLLTTLEKIPGLTPLPARDETHPDSVTPENSNPAKPPARSNALRHGVAGAGITIVLLGTLTLFINTEESPPATIAETQTPVSTAAAPATQPAPVQPVVKPPAAHTLNANLQMNDIDLSGTWFDDDGTRFEITQKGNKVIAAGFNIFGMASKQLSGTVHGNTLTFTLQDGFVTTDGSGSLNPDGQHFDYTLISGDFSEEGQLHFNHTRN